jgi:hypothetical protein
MLVLRPRFTIRRAMVAMGITAVAMAGLQSPNTWLTLFSFEILMVGVPTAMIAPGRESPSATWIKLACVLAMISLPIAVWLTLIIQARLHGYML